MNHEISVDQSLREEAELEARIEAERTESELSENLSPEEMCVAMGHDEVTDDFSGSGEGSFVRVYCKRCGARL